MGEQIMEGPAMAKVTIVDGKVVKVTEPRVKYCPLFKKFRNIDEFDCATVKENVEFRIADFGLCTDRRVTRLDYFLNFGISELLSMALKQGRLDAAVIAADGCGTAVFTDPGLIQGMGGRVSAIIRTEPAPSVIAAVGADRVLDPATARIDQPAGVAKAFAMGFRRVGVTTPFAEEARQYRERYGDRIMIFGVHTTGITEAQARMFFANADVITACASKWVREVAQTEATLQAGTKVPIYGASAAGAELMRAKLKELGKEPDHGLTDSPRPLL